MFPAGCMDHAVRTGTGRVCEAVPGANSTLYLLSINMLFQAGKDKSRFEDMCRLLMHRDGRRSSPTLTSLPDVMSQRDGHVPCWDASSDAPFMRPCMLCSTRVCAVTYGNGERRQHSGPNEVSLSASFAFLDAMSCHDRMSAVPTKAMSQRSAPPQHPAARYQIAAFITPWLGCAVLQVGRQEVTLHGLAGGGDDDGGSHSTHGVHGGADHGWAFHAAAVY